MTILRQDYFARGDWNAICDGCGAKLKGSALRKDWQGFMKCGRCWEPRHSQDFVRARPGAEPAPVPFSRGPGEDVLAPAVCSMNSQSALPDVGTADCAVCDYISPSYDPSIL